MKILKQIFLSVALLVLLILGFNIQFFWKNILYTVTTINYSIKHGEKQSDFDEITVKKKLQPNFIYIPQLDITAPIIEPTSDSGTDFQKAVAKGVAHYPGTAKAGEYGNVYLFGHSSDLPWSEGSYKTVFALLPHIEIGAEIILTNELGKEFVYVVYDKFVAEKTATHLLEQYDFKEQILTLQTSWPLGTALKRYIVLARLKD